MDVSEMIWAQREYNEAYQEYTNACHNASSAHTDDDKKKSSENLKKAYVRFDEAYKNLKVLQVQQ